MTKFLLFLPTLAWACSMLGTAIMLRILIRKQVMDNPNERSNHKAPVPRGGGIAMIIVSLVCFTVLGISPRIIAAALLLGVVSFADDLRCLPASIRFMAQFIAVAIAIPALPTRLFPDVIPAGYEFAFIALLWLWFINLTNFMDGIDGISASQAIMMMTGIILYHALVVPLPVWLAVSAGVVAGSALGFLRFNFSPARLFMGDVGSIPLGFIGGFLLLSLAAYGHWQAAILLPAYYLTDATLTLLKRAVRGEKVWQAHSEHAYQKAVRRGLSHNAVVARITLLNMLLVTLALYQAPTMMAALLTCVAGYVAALVLVCHLSRC